MNSSPIPLGSAYRAEFSRLARERWNPMLAQFTDANLYQTWEYDGVRFGGEHVEHLVLRRDDQIVAAAQARLARVPGLPFGAAYVRWGPLWRRPGAPEDGEVLRMAIRALRNEFVCRRRLILRLFPLVFVGQGNLPVDLFESEHFVPSPGETPQQTLILNLKPPLSELRSNFQQKWRNCLNHAERNQLVIVQGTEDALFDDFIPLYRQLVDRKKFAEPNDINEFQAIQRQLPPSLKMGIFLCAEQGVLTGGAIFSAVGGTGVYLFGATNDLGLKNKGAYLLQWRALQWLREQGCRYFNLNGINPVANPGSYHFKAGLAGRFGLASTYAGRFDSYPGELSQSMVRLGVRLMPRFKRFATAPRRE